MISSPSLKFNPSFSCLILSQVQIIEFNSYGTRWQKTAKILENAHNGGNELDSAKIAKETPPEIQR